MPRRIAMLAMAGLASAAPCLAQDEITIYSARADAVEITIYPDNLALITETRTIELPESPSTLIIQDVADTLLPQSAVVRDLDRPLAESNFDFNRLTPAALLEHAVGQSVTLMRTNPVTGVLSSLPATVVSVSEAGVVLETADGQEALYCSGLPEGIVFERIPEGLYASPQLSLRLAGGVSGEKTITVSYLAHGFEWYADYVAHLDEQSGAMDLSGWATVSNASGRSFSQVDLQLVAGQLNVLDFEEGGSREELSFDELSSIGNDAGNTLRFDECFAAEGPELPAFRRNRGDVQFETVIVTGARIVREEFGDYHLYRLPWPTDLGARQTKQVLFLDRDEVRVERFYRQDVYGIDPYVYAGAHLLGSASSDRSVEISLPSVIIRARNTSGAGLGEPLPRGQIRIFERYEGRTVLAGLARIDDSPVGSTMDLQAARAIDVVVEMDFLVEDDNRDLMIAEAHYLAVNDKDVPIEFEIRHADYSVENEIYAIEESSRPYTRDDGFFVWRFTVPPGAETLSYTISLTILND